MLDINSTGLVRTSTDFAFGSLSLRGSYLSSMRVFIVGLSDRQNILCRILVTVVGCLAFRAIPLADVKRQALYYVSAATTPLARREETVDLDQRLAIPAALIRQHLSKCAETCIGNALGKVVILNHASHI